MNKIIGRILIGALAVSIPVGGAIYYFASNNSDEEKKNEIVDKKVNTNEKVDLSGINVLVVEDNEINWEVISTLLDLHGISSERAENGKVAVDLVSNKDNENRYDLIFMDIQMPVMNGLDATREIRKLGNNIPIIAMTADAFSENITECLNAGMNGHIAKPIDINIVLNEIKKIKSK